jgi:C1A family cysteine protease
MRLPINRVLRPPSGALVGGHLFTLFGYDDAINGESVAMRNSWGRWSYLGNGNGWMRLRYFLSHRPEVWATTDVDD